MRFVTGIITLFLVPFIGRAQSPQQDLMLRGETELIVKEAKRINGQLSPANGIFLDHAARPDYLKVVVNTKGYQFLVEKGIDFAYEPRKEADLRTLGPGEINQMKSGQDCLPVFDFYPSYEAYLDIMYQFEENFPEMCRIIELGTLDSGRKILVAKLGTESIAEERKPGFLYTATMHGNELIGYPLMLQLIDHLLCRYDSDDLVRFLMDNVNIYINPLANPDGTFRGGDDTVEGATRLNAYFADLNRNFPDPKAGPNPDGLPRQDETSLFMEFADSRNIHVSCNIHSGVEVVNYPWDTYPELHPDNDWFVRVSRDYAQVAQEHSPDGYMTYLNNGITNGYQWYEVEGGRQDYHTFFKRGREIVLELSDTKLLDASAIPDHWEYNREALLNYIMESTYSFNGRVTDCITGEPIKAEIFIEGYDERQSSVFSDSLSGQFFRYLPGGFYELRVQSEGYVSENYALNIFDRSSITQDFELCPDDIMSSADYFEIQPIISLEGNKILVDSPFALDELHFNIYSISGQKLSSGPIIDKSINVDTNIPDGIFILELLGQACHQSFKLSLFR